MTEDSPGPRFSERDVVRLRRRTAVSGSIARPGRLVNGRYSYGVIIDGRIHTIGEGDLEPIDLVSTDAREAFLQGSFGDRASVVTHLTFLRLSEALSNYVYAFQNSRTQFFPHQFKPLLKFLEGTGRLLIADEVGLGKTIEAGLVLTELRARRQLHRSLVVCPANLRDKWQRELLTRFDLEFRVMAVDDLAKGLRDLAESPDGDFFGICSYDTLRTERVIEALDGAPFRFDLVVADESHRLRNQNTRTYEAGERLAEAADHLILLSATPINNRDEDLFNQLRLLDDQLFGSKQVFDLMQVANQKIVELERVLRRDPPPTLDDVRQRLTPVAGLGLGSIYADNPAAKRLLELIAEHGLTEREHLIEAQRLAHQLNVLSQYLNRTRRRDVAYKPPKREPHTHPVPMTEAERALYTAVLALARKHYNDFRFPVIAMERTMASCMPAFVRKYRRALPQAQVGGSEEDDPFENDDDTADSQIPGLSEVLAEHGAAVLAAEEDSKLKVFFEIIANIDRDHELRQAERVRVDSAAKPEPKPKLIVFSYFRGTIAHIEEALGRRKIPCVVIHGGIQTNPTDPERDERAKRRYRFEHEESVRVLVSSEVGSEGLDFQFAHVLINYDLPWNPMVVEQRIGRIDRIGQKADRLLIYSLVLEDTIDRRIHELLLEKIGIFQSSIGDLESILGATIHDLQRAIFTPRLSPEEEAEQIEHARDVLVRRRKDLEELEQGSARIVGTNQYLEEEIERVRTGKRFVGPSELESFVHAMFARPEINLDVVRAEPKIYRATVTVRLRDFLSRHLDPSRPAMLFRGRTGKDEMQWTFDQEVAVETPQIELFNINHPLVRALVHQLSDGGETGLAPNFRVEIDPLEGVSGSAWALGVYLLELTTEGKENARRELLALPMDIEAEHVADAATGDRLLSAILGASRDIAEDVGDWKPEVADAIVDRLDAAADSYAQARTDKFQGDEVEYVRRRRAQVDADLRRRIGVEERRRTKLAQTRMKSLDETKRRQMDNLLRGVDKKIEQAREDARVTLDSLPTAPRVSYSYQLRSIGLITCVHRKPRGRRK